MDARQSGAKCDVGGIVPIEGWVFLDNVDGGGLRDGAVSVGVIRSEEDGQDMGADSEARARRGGVGKRSVRDVRRGV